MVTLEDQASKRILALVATTRKLGPPTLLPKPSWIAMKTGHASPHLLRSTISHLNKIASINQGEEGGQI